MAESWLRVGVLAWPSNGQFGSVGGPQPF